MPHLSAAPYSQFPTTIVSFLSLQQLDLLQIVYALHQCYYLARTLVWQHNKLRLFFSVMLCGAAQ